MKVVMLQDWHGVSESVDRQVELIPRYVDGSERVRILHEPICDELVNDGSSGVINLNANTEESLWYYLDLEHNWGPADAYRRFYRFIYDMAKAGKPAIELGPLDNDLRERNDLATEFKDLVLDYRKGIDAKDRERQSRRFDRLKRNLSFMRESGFCERIDDTKYAEASPDTVIVITHPAHIDRCASYLARTQEYRVEIAEVDPELVKELGAKEDEIQLNFAKDRDVLSMRSPPPIVPVVTLAWTEVKF